METKFLLLVLLAIPPGQGLDTTACDICLDGVCYGGNMLLNSSKIRRNDAVAIDRTNHTLYFVDSEDNTLKVLNLTDKSIEATPITIGHHYDGIAVDQNTQDMYILDTSVIYKYQPATNESFKYYLSHNFEKIWFKDKLYALGNPYIFTVALYSEGENQAKVYTALRNVENMYWSFIPRIIDRRGDMYFTGCVINTQICKTYKLPNGTETPVEILNSTKILLAMDRDDNAYFIYQTNRTISIQRFDDDTNQYVEVGLFELPPYVELIYNALFDKDNNIVLQYWIKKSYLHELHYFEANSKRCRITRQVSVIEEL